jgi:hypothetical protein
MRPLPIPSGASFGAKIARCPVRQAIAQANSRSTTAASAARKPSSAPTVPHIAAGHIPEENYPA